ncbi:MAG: alpha/beta hydrolase [Bacteroidota bacterium]
MKPLIQVLVLIPLFIACNKTNEKETTAINRSIYSNFKTGENEWYLTNPKDTTELYVFEWGMGKDTIVVLHGGFGAEHRYLKDAFDGLYEKFHFVFYDQRGSLRSPCPIEKISIANHVNDLEAIRKELGIEKLNLFGHSNGTTLATYYLKAHPDRVKGFVMAACMQMQYPIKETDSVLKGIEREGYEGFQEYIDRPEVQAEIDQIEKDTTLPPSKKKYQIERVNQAKYYIYDITKWKDGKESYGAFMNYRVGNATTKTIQGTYNNIELYQNHPFPVTIIMGEKDMIDPGGGKFNYWTKDLENVHYIMIEKASHDPWVDEPEKFRKEFVNAMKRYTN